LDMRPVSFGCAQAQVLIEEREFAGQFVTCGGEMLAGGGVVAIAEACVDLEPVPVERD